MAKTLTDDFGWDPNDAKKVWCFGPEFSGSNLLVDQTKGCFFMNEIMDSCKAGFTQVTRHGVLCEE